MAEAIKPQFEPSCRCPPRGTESRSGLSFGDQAMTPDVYLCSNSSELATGSYLMLHKPFAIRFISAILFRNV